MLGGLMSLSTSRCWWTLPNADVIAMAMHRKVPTSIGPPSIPSSDLKPASLTGVARCLLPFCAVEDRGMELAQQALIEVRFHDTHLEGTMLKRNDRPITHTSQWASGRA